MILNKMPNAPWQQKIVILKLIKSMFKTDERISILDVGCGIGSTGCILRTGLANLNLELTGVELFKPYFQYMKKYGIDRIYDLVFHIEAESYLTSRPDNMYSIVLLIDILEHLTSKSAINVYRNAQRLASKAVIATIPFTSSKRGGDGQNKYMAHLEAYPNEASVISTFPGLKLVRKVQSNGVFLWQP